MCIDMRNVAQQSHELIESFEGKLRYHFRRYGTSLTPSPLQRCVQLCLSAMRYADTLLLAIKGRDQLLQCTQKAYFERQTNEHPYLRLFQRIVTNDLDDVVQNADLTEWVRRSLHVCERKGIRRASRTTWSTTRVPSRSSPCREPRWFGRQHRGCVGTKEDSHSDLSRCWTSRKAGQYLDRRTGGRGRASDINLRAHFNDTPLEQY